MFLQKKQMIHEVIVVGQKNVNIRADEEQTFPFELTLENDPFYSPANIARLKKAAADLDAGRGTVHELIEDEDDE